MLEAANDWYFWWRKEKKKVWQKKIQITFFPLANQFVAESLKP